MQHRNPASAGTVVVLTTALAALMVGVFRTA
jgi:hypothetical protein